MSADTNVASRMSNTMADSYCLYAIRLPVDDYAIAYIGVTKRPRGRWADHAKGREFIGRAVAACGRRNVVFEILATGSRESILSTRNRSDCNQWHAMA